MIIPNSQFIIHNSPIGASVQGGGRWGYAALGLPESGPLDPYAHAAANLLLGNTADAAAVEIVALGVAPLLECVGGGLIALTGADFGAMVNGRPIPTWHSAWLRDGETLQFVGQTNKPLHGVAYLAVAGGLHLPRYLGSTSAYLGAAGALPELAGRYIVAADVLPFTQRGQPQQAGRTWPLDGQGAHRYAATEIDIIWGPHAVRLKHPTALLAQLWTVGESNRMGMRLEGAPLPMKQNGEVISFGVLRGAVQLPPNGLPIILGPDHQTTGGYPLIAVVAQASWPTLGQLLPGDQFRLRSLTITRAKFRLKQQQDKLRQLMLHLQNPRQCDILAQMF